MLYSTFKVPSSPRVALCAREVLCVDEQGLEEPRSHCWTVPGPTSFSTGTRHALLEGQPEGGGGVKVLHRQSLRH